MLFLRFRRFQALKLQSPVPTSYVTLKEMNFEVILILFLGGHSFALSALLWLPKKKKKINQVMQKKLSLMKEFLPHTEIWRGHSCLYMIWL